jgi:hypothetical protein
VNAVTRRDRWQNAFIYALVTTIMVLSVAALLNGFLGVEQRRLAERVDRNAAIAVQTAQVARVEAENTRDLICSILVNSENPDIRAAVRLHC